MIKLTKADSDMANWLKTRKTTGRRSNKETFMACRARACVGGGARGRACVRVRMRVSVCVRLLVGVLRSSEGVTRGAFVYEASRSER